MTPAVVAENDDFKPVEHQGRYFIVFPQWTEVDGCDCRTVNLKKFSTFIHKGEMVGWV